MEVDEMYSGVCSRVLVCGCAVVGASRQQITLKCLLFGFINLFHEHMKIAPALFIARTLLALSEHSQWSPPPAHASAPRSKPSSAPSMTSRRWTTAPPSLACASEVVLLPAPQQGVLAAHGTHCHHSCRPCRHPRPYPFAGSGGLSHRRRAPTYMPFLTLSHMLLSSSLVPYLPSPCYVTRRDTHTRRAS